MLSTDLTIGQTICFENTVCKHYCKITSIIKNVITLAFHKGTYETDYNNKYLRELRPFEENFLKELGLLN